MFGLLTRIAYYLASPATKILNYLGYGNCLALTLLMFIATKLIIFISNRIMNKHPSTFPLFMLGFFYITVIALTGSMLLWIALLD